MPQEDKSLSSCFQKLELDLSSTSSSSSESPQPPIQQPEKPANIFMRRRRSKSLSSINFGPTCECLKKNQNIKHTTSFKRASKRILREPILKFFKCTHVASNEPHAAKSHCKRKEKLFGQNGKSEEVDFKSILDACEQLTIDKNVSSYSTPSFLTARTHSVSRVEGGASASSSTSCSHQARMSAPPACDVTIDELASYFETFVHIPKKMSSMAEMMYI